MDNRPSTILVEETSEPDPVTRIMDLKPGEFFRWHDCIYQLVDFSSAYPHVWDYPCLRWKTTFGGRFSVVNFTRDGNVIVDRVFDARVLLTPWRGR